MKGIYVVFGSEFTIVSVLFAEIHFPQLSSHTCLLFAVTVRKILSHRAREQLEVFLAGGSTPTRTRFYCIDSANFTRIMWRVWARSREITRNLRAGITHVRNITTENQERKINVNGMRINYLKVGNGPHTVLLTPGVVGTIWTDFKPQIEHLDREKFTLIAWEPPGDGKSRPPDRQYPVDFPAIDAMRGAFLMDYLGYEKFSLIGWSAGGITSIAMAALVPERIQRLVVISACPYFVQEELAIFEKLRNIDAWSENKKAAVIQIYGKEYAQKCWSAFIDLIGHFLDYENGNLCVDQLEKIKCPTLVVQGDADPLIHRDKLDFLRERIKNSRAVGFNTAAHDVHLSNSQEFNRLVTEFLLEE